MSIRLEISGDTNPRGLYYVHTDTLTVANWGGGIYIDLGYVDEHGLFHATDLINIGYNDSRSGHGHEFRPEVLAAIVDDYFNRLIAECDGEGEHPDGGACPGCNLCD